MIKAIVFDFDGVIVLSEQARFAALQRLCKRHGVEIPDDLFRNIIGRTSRDFFKLNFPDIQTEVLEKIMQDYQREYKDNIVDHVTPIAFTTEYIDTYSGDKLLAVASGSDTKILDTLLQHLGLYNKFAVIAGKEHVTKHKPDPEVYLHVAKKLKLEPRECVVIEDTPAGVQAANAAGMSVFVLLNGVNSPDDFTTVQVAGFIADLEQLQKALE